MSKYFYVYDKEHMIYDHMGFFYGKGFLVSIWESSIIIRIDVDHKTIADNVSIVQMSKDIQKHNGIILLGMGNVINEIRVLSKMYAERNNNYTDQIVFSLPNDYSKLLQALNIGKEKFQFIDLNIVL